MSNDIFENSDVNGTGISYEGASHGRFSFAHQQQPGRHPATARVNWD